jgi:adenosylmethionine-8-amino-7-oxononanoate aminotransferase
VLSGIRFVWNYTANPIGCAAALASLDLFTEESVLEKALPRMQRLQAESQRFGDLPCVGDVRGIGMVAAFELVQDKQSKEPMQDVRAVGLDIYRQGLEKGLILRPLGPVSYLFLPLCTTDEELDEILKKTYAILAAVSL